MHVIRWPSPFLPTQRSETAALSRSSSRFISIFLAGLLLTALCAGAGAAPVGGGNDMQRMREALERNLAQGDYEMCRILIKEMMRFQPGNPVLHYNQACVATLEGDVGGAMTSLRQAVELGYDDVRTLESDEDLKPLRGTPAYKRLIVDLVDKLLADAGAHVFRFTDGEWSNLGLLEDKTSRRTIALAMKFDDDGFHVRATGPAEVIRPTTTRGGELLVTLSVPDSLRSFDTRSAWRFGFGSHDGHPAGRMLGLPGRPLHQRVVELAPAFHAGVAPDELTIAAHIPWSYLSPYGLPADRLFGVNIGHTGPGRFNQLIPDPGMANAQTPWHRFRPIRMSLRDDSTPRLSGRIRNAVVGDKILMIELSAWSDHAGRAVLTTDVTDPAGATTVSAGGEGEEVEIKPGLNVWKRGADLSAMPDGPYRLTATLTRDDGETLDWETGVLRFRGMWLSRTRDRTKPLSKQERASIEWRLGLVQEEMRRRDLRTYPAPMATTIADVESLLARHAETGTILPAAGDITVACPSDDGLLLQVPLALSPGWAQDGTAPLLVLLDAGGQNVAGIISALSARLKEATAAIAAGPSLPAVQAGVWDDGTRAAARTAVSWLRDRFPDRPLLFASLDDATDAVDLANAFPGAVTDTRFFTPDDDAVKQLMEWLAD